ARLAPFTRFTRAAYRSGRRSRQLRGKRAVLRVRHRRSTSEPRSSRSKRSSRYQRARMSMATSASDSQPNPTLSSPKSYVACPDLREVSLENGVGAGALLPPPATGELSRSRLRASLDLRQPPAYADEEEPRVFEKLGGLAFECVADELK